MSIERNRGNNNAIPLSGIGYVVIPQDADPAEYVQRCYRNHCVSISGGYDSSYMHNVKITEEALNKIVFPGDESGLGSPVVWIRDSFTNRAVVIGTLKNAGESNLTQTGQQRLCQETSTCTSEVFLDALNGAVNVNAQGDDSVAAIVNIKASSRSAEGDVVNIISKDIINQDAKQFRLNLTDNFSITINNGEKDIITIKGNGKEFHYTDQFLNEVIMNEEETHIKDQFKNEFYTNKDELHGKDQFENEVVTNKDEFHVTDQFKNEFVVNKDEIHLTDQFSNEIITNKDNVQILTNKFNVGKGKEKMVLGDTLIKLIGQILDGITSLTVTTHVGPSGTPLNAAVFSSIKGQLNSALSQLSNTD